MRQSKKSGKNYANIKILSILILLAIFVTSIPLSASAEIMERLENDMSFLPVFDPVVPVLGDSSKISTAEALLELSAKVNDGEDMTGKTFTLLNDIDLKGTTWVPIGTQANPFSGTFDGAGFSVSGMAMGQTFFGYLKNATVKNLALKTNTKLGDSGIYTGLFISSVNSTIENCISAPEVKTVTLGASRGLVFRQRSVSASYSWYDSPGANNGSSAATPYKIGTASDLYGLYNIVGGTRGSDDFDGKFIELTAGSYDVSAAASSWMGIGNLGHPFKGTMIGDPTSGTKITGLEINQPNEDNVGFLGYTEEATISDIQIVGADVVGNNNVGALLGYGRDTKADNCMSSGNVEGLLAVGGLIGLSDRETVFKNGEAGLPVNQEWLFFVTTTASVTKLEDYVYTKYCYSTADVKGSSSVGGLIGNDSGNRQRTYMSILPNYTVSNLGNFRTAFSFASGNVTGLYEVGGLIGTQDNGANIIMCSSSGTVRAITAAGGLVGRGPKWITHGTSGLEDITISSIVSSYTSSKVYGSYAVGGLLGLDGNIYYGYTSGNVIAPDIGIGTGVSPIVELNSNSSSGDAGNNKYLFADPNTVYPTSNPKNLDTSPSAVSGYKNVGHGNIKYFDNETPPYLAGPAYWGNVGMYLPGEHSSESAIVYSNPGATDNSGPNIPVSGSYPELFPFVTGYDYGALTATAFYTEYFGSQHSQSVFQTYSKLTTRELGLHNMPVTLSLDTDKFALDEQGALVVLPTGTTTTLTWNFSNGGKTMDIDDPGLPNGNKLTITSAGNIKADYPLSEALDFTLVASTPVAGLEMKYDMSLPDDVLHHFEDSVPESFYISDTLAKAPGAEVLSPSEIMETIEFAESVVITPTGAAKADIYEYSDYNFGGAGTLIGSADIKVIDDATMRFRWPSSLLEYERAYRIEFVKGDTVSDFVDASGTSNEWESHTYYFRTIPNEEARLEFDPDYSLAQASVGGSTTTTTSNNDTQVVYLEENSPEMLGIFDGITAVNETYINVANEAIVGYTLMSPHPLSGKEGYPTVNNGNFYQVPGEYVLTYKVPDPEVSGIESNTVTRTYRVHSPGMVTKGGAPLDILDIRYTTDDLEDITDIMASKGMKFQQALQQKLQDDFVTKPGPNQLKAFYYDHTATAQTAAITFNVSAVTDDALIEGFNQAISFTVTGSSEEHMAILYLPSSLPDVQIVVDANSFETSDPLTYGSMKRFFNARVVRKSDPTIPVNLELKYDYRRLDHSKYNVPQTFAIYIPEYQDSTLPGVAEATTVYVNVVLRKNSDSFDIEVDVAQDYWENKLPIIRNGKADRTFNFDIPYKAGESTPADFFRVVANQDNATVNLEYPSGIVLSFESGKIDSTLIPKDVNTYSINVEPMYNYYIDRDLKGVPSQQFFTSTYQVPGVVTMKMPFDSKMDTEDISLYYLNETTNTYEFVREIKPNAVIDGVLTLKMDEFLGQYIITTADLDGVKSTAPPALKTPEKVYVIKPEEE